MKKKFYTLRKNLEAGVTLIEKTRFMTIRTLLISVLMTLVCANAGATKKIAFPGGKCTLFRVTLKDKKGTPYSLSHPDIYLSEKALQRRAKQKIELDSTDLPINPYYIE